MSKTYRVICVDDDNQKSQFKVIKNEIYTVVKPHGPNGVLLSEVPNEGVDVTGRLWRGHKASRFNRIDEDALNKEAVANITVRKKRTSELQD